MKALQTALATRSPMALACNALRELDALSDDALEHALDEGAYDEIPTSGGVA